MKHKSLEDALAELEAKKAQTAEYLAKHAPEIEAATAKRNALNAKLAALSQEERKQVLDAAGLKHVSAAPEPITPLRGSSYRPPNKPPEMVAMAEQKNKLSEEERKRTKELDAMRVPGDGGQTFSSRWLPSESQQQTPELPAPPAVAVGASGGVEQTPDAERRLARLRALGGTAKYVRHEWKFTGMADLVESEKADDRKRRSEKTIRADLIQAAKAERDEKSAGFGAGLGQR